MLELASTIMSDAKHMIDWRVTRPPDVTGTTPACLRLFNLTGTVDGRSLETTALTGYAGGIAKTRVAEYLLCESEASLLSVETAVMTNKELGL